MKKLLFAICAVATLASCSKDEVVSYDKGEAIGFSNPFVNKATRAVSATDPSFGGTNNPLTAFDVWGTANGVAIYRQDEVTGAVGNGEWTCDQKNYWINGAEYQFAALAPVDLVNVTETDDLPVSFPFTTNSSADTDLIYATATATGKASGENDPVALTFSHLLSKVKFSVTNASTTATGYSFKITNIKVNGFKSGVAFLSSIETTPATATWETDEEEDESGDYAVADITIANGDAAEECAQELLLIPGSFDISFWVETYKDGTLVDTKKYDGTETAQGRNKFPKSLAIGTSYNFIINVKVGNEITFSVTTNPNWTSAGNGDTLVQ